MTKLREYQAMFERATDTGKPDRDKSLAGWHERASMTRRALMEIRAKYQADLDELRETYSPKTFAEKRKKADDDYNTIIEIAKRKIAADLETVLEGKRLRFDECNGAPSDENLRLLTALGMRDSLTAAEVAAVSGKFDGNVQCLRLLRDIAKRSGISFPNVGSPEVFEEQISNAEQFGKSMIETISTDTKELPYRARVFWEAPGAGEAVHFFGPLDGQGFSAEQITDFAAEQKRQERNERADQTKAIGNASREEFWSEVKIGNQYLHTIAQQFHVSTEQIRQANPSLDLSRLHSGQKILVPSTKFTFQPDPSGGHVQPEQVRAVPKPTWDDPLGPGGVKVGQDIDITMI